MTVTRNDILATGVDSAYSDESEIDNVGILAGYGKIGLDNEPPGAPVNVTRPVVTGASAIGSTLTCTPGTWTGAVSIAHQWQHNGTNIDGATGLTYVVVENDAAANIRCKEIATNAIGDTRIWSNAISIPAELPVNTVAPVISGTPEAGEVITCTQGTWTGNPTPTYTYQWTLDGVNITGERSSTYTILDTDKGHTLACDVTGTNAAGSVDATSNSMSIAAYVYYPSELFEDGAQGVWYDPSDLSTMFQDSAGTTPVTADGQPVGLILDKSGRNNHASQATAAKRPIYKERINLVSYSENITAHFDVLTHVTITPNAVTAPDGTATADLMTEGTNLNTYFGVTRNTIVPTGEGSHTVSAWVKPNGRNYFILYAYGDYSSYFGKYFELIGSGAVLGDYYAAPTNATITAFPNGWYLCTMTVPISLADNGVWFDVYLSPDGLTDTYNGDGASGAYVWGIQIAKGAEFGPYQRVENDVYNTVGLPKWLQFDGVDDRVSSASFDLSGTSAASLFLGVFRPNDSGYKCYAEFGPPDTTGGFYFAGRNSVSGYETALAGSGGQTIALANTSAPPITEVATVALDYSQPTNATEIIFRVNGVVEATSQVGEASAGDGPFGNFALNVGSRSTGSLPVTGNIYSMIFLGRTAATQEITDTETWVADKTGVTLP